MSIRQLEVGRPFFDVRHIDNEDNVKLDSLVVLMNLSLKQEDILIEGMPLHPFKATIVGHVTIPHIDCGVMVANWESVKNDPEIFEKIAGTWPRMDTLRTEERFKGLPHYKSTGNGDVTELIHVGCACLAQKCSPGIHMTHPKDVDEYHCQILGYGRMDKFFENDFSTIYQSVTMAPGQIHEKFFDENGDYPWHGYSSEGPAVFMGIQVLRKKL